MRIRLARLAAWLGLCVSSPSALPGDAAVMLGPMFHCNFASGRPAAWSFGFEVSYWNAHSLPVGVDGGMEYTVGKFRIYGEMESGIIFAGGGLGPVIEIDGGDIVLGLQGSAWANAFAGADFRARKLLGSPWEWAPGYYLKIPVLWPQAGMGY